MQKIVAKLIISIAALTVSATLVGMFSYAWLTMSGAPEVDGIQISVGGGNTIMVAADMVVNNDDGTITHYPGRFSHSLHLFEYDTYDYLSSLAGLTPVSTADGVNWVRPAYYGEDSEEAKSGEVLVGQLRDIADFQIDTTLEYANLPADKLTGSMVGNYAYVDFWVVSPADNYKLRVSTGDKEENGSFVISRMEAVENENARYGYDFKMINEATASSVRLGFLASNDWCTYVDNLTYNASDEYDSRFSFLKGRYLEKGSTVAFDSSNSKFTIYEPNADYHISEKYDKAYYKITRPVGVVNGELKEVNVSDRLTVQLENKWSTGGGGNGILIEQLFQTFIAGKDLTSKNAAVLTEEFYEMSIQNVIYPYVDRGYFIKRTESLYAAANEKGYVFEENPALENVSGATDDVFITTLEKNIPQRIRMFVWLEGQDEDCINYGEISSFIVNLELAGSND